MISFVVFLQFVKNIHDMTVRKMYKLCTELQVKLSKRYGRVAVNDMMSLITLEKNGKALDFFPGEVSTDRITAIQEAYWSLASALSESDGVDYTDPEKLAECTSSPDVNTRQALANALAAAPSMWTLENVGMGTLQRPAEDSNLAVAVAAFKAIDKLKRQWEIEEGDSWRFTMNNQM
ncbi:hypothetical protein AAC387_Pa03g2163 [Persea americana]